MASEMLRGLHASVVHWALGYGRTLICFICSNPTQVGSAQKIRSGRDERGDLFPTWVLKHSAEPGGEPSRADFSYIGSLTCLFR